jgi:dihydroorotase
MVMRDIEIAGETGCTIVVQHISAAQSVDLIRQARSEGIRVHAEATPHHFTLTEDAVREYGTLAKMNPPLRLESDRVAIIEGLKDGTIDMIATDHAPHCEYEKEKTFTEAPSGIIGLETAFSLALRELVEPGYMSLMRVLRRMTEAARLYGLGGGCVREGGPADLMLFDPEAKWTVPERGYSKAVNTPFVGQKMPGVIRYTVCSGKVVYESQYLR